MVKIQEYLWIRVSRDVPFKDRSNGKKKYKQP